MPPKKTEKTDPVAKPRKKTKAVPKPEKKAKPVPTPEEKQAKTEKPASIEVKNSKGTVIGDFANVVNNFIQTVDEKVLQRLGIEQRVGFLLIGLLLVGGFSGIYFGLRQTGKNIMTGEFRIAIASFAENGKKLPKELGYTIADGINISLASDLKEITVGPKVTIWGPDKVGTIKGTTAEDRAQNAEKLAKKIQAHMIIYGAVEDTPNGMRVIPEFYLAKPGFHQGSEILGQYASAAFSLPGADSPDWQFTFDNEMKIRTDIVSSLAQGLSFLAVHDYETALEKFQSIEDIKGWEDDQGKEVLYTLIGFTAGKAKQYDLTRSSLEKAIGINSEYARPYVGMANLNYVLAVTQYQQSKKIEAVDQTLLDQCFAYLDLAVQAPEKPPLADVDTKIHFSRGQCYWLRTYTGQLDDYSLAISEFQQVLDAYGDGKNPRVQEFAAESHARLGFIATYEYDTSNALIHYQEAIKLLPDDPERQAVFQEAVDKLKQSLLTPTP
jgi:tetratricopeptide (TPR) repeat protein